MKNVLAVVKFLFSIGLASFDYFTLFYVFIYLLLKKKKVLERNRNSDLFGNF